MTIKSYPKKRPYRDPEYLKFIGEQPGMFEGEKADAHHIRRHRWGAGASCKPHDYCTLPVDQKIHRTSSATKFEKTLNVERRIISYLIKYIRKNDWELDLIDNLMEFIHSKKG